MFSSYIFPYYRSPYFGGFGTGFVPGIFPAIGYGSQFVGGYGGINAIGSAISNQSLINTGSAIGITQTSTPTVIW